MAVGNIADLVRRCVEGDDAAMAEFYSEYSGLVRSAVSRKLSSLSSGGPAGPPLRNETDDVCHETFARIFADDCRALGQLRNPQSLCAWLTTVSQHCAVDYVRKWSGEFSYLEMGEVADEREPYGESAEMETDDLVQTCLGELPDDERLILEMFFLHGLKYVEIAEILGMNINTMSARLRRAKLKLRKALGVTAGGGEHELVC